MTEQEVSLLRQQLRALRQALARAQADNTRLWMQQNSQVSESQSFLSLSAGKAEYGHVKGHHGCQVQSPELQYDARLRAQPPSLLPPFQPRNKGSNPKVLSLLIFGNYEKMLLICKFIFMCVCVCVCVCVCFSEDPFTTRCLGT
jgi:hypothetical protein